MMETIIPVHNETTVSFVRSTKEGKKITYKLQVLQQPERARACGSGAKSSADRRPVDPPPIVELRIFEGENADNDITFSMSANYFLFATLEQARPIAQGRVPQNPNQLCVLTGTPVAGMVYLDRPAAAGYFIFPDLSVRHEGKYRLSFNLYEELKDTKDEDQVADGDEKTQGVSDAHVTHRVEVKSEPFTVYSAKKFPGLASSTSLSRTVAEQGCRVRIRRDIRQRKREKGSKDEWNGHDEEYERQFGTPDGYGVQRPRSASIGSHGSHASLVPAAVSRRPSQQEMTQMYQQQQHQQGYPQYPGPQAAQSAYPHTTTAQYGSQYQISAANMHPSMPPPPQQAHLYAYSHPPQAPSHQSYYGSYQAPHQHMPAPLPYDMQHHGRNGSYDLPPQPSHEHLAATGQIPPPPPPGYAHAPPQVSAVHHQPGNYGVQSSYNGFPNASEATRTSSISTPSTGPGPMTSTNRLPPLITSIPSSRDKLLEASPISAGPVPRQYDARGVPSTTLPPPSSYTQAYESAPAPASTKRSYSSVFPSQHMNDPLRGGARPHEPATNGYTDTEYASEEPSRSSLYYKRADGTNVSRAIPVNPRM